MGEELARIPIPASAADKGSTNPRSTAGTGIATAGNPRPAAATPRPAPAAAADRNTGTGTRPGAAAEKEKVSGLVSLKDNPAVPAPEEPKKRQQRKPRKKKEEPQNFNAEQLSALILSMSAIVASRPDMKIWQLRPEEAKQLATPISNMVAKSEKLSNMGEYADAISLVTASLVIFGPRTMVYMEQQKAKKIKQNGGVKLVRTDGKEAKISGSDERTTRQTSNNGAEHDSGFRSAIPATIY